MGIEFMVRRGIIRFPTHQFASRFGTTSRQYDQAIQNKFCINTRIGEVIQRKFRLTTYYVDCLAAIRVGQKAY
jgi:hypothetical protein